MADVVPIPVTTGFSWTAAGAWTSAFALIGVLVRQWVPLRKVRVTEFESVIQAQKEEITRLSDRVGTLEKSIDGIRDRYEQILAFERASHEAELGLQRHATRGTKQILYGMLDLIEAAPEKAAEHAAKMRQRLIELEEAERAEAATIRSAKIMATAKSPLKPSGEAA
ncbi:hypothetical protein [Sphingomonas sp. SRS2]|uniref:hypothetical protein n=1 Tax=Sphingomonas sp. SRS2 TaxID=133190 RepID=UPI0006184487|nr:hypothetical protein [Sphingomonas sp. SRS2]KKC24446.1 hypothetical protein WP12_19335 [Sphingomonas sp. SRS2]